MIIQDCLGRKMLGVKIKKEDINDKNICGVTEKGNSIVIAVRLKKFVNVYFDVYRDGVWSNEATEVTLAFVVLDKEEAYPIILKAKEAIKNRKNPEDRFELWECNNIHGVYDFDLNMRLLKSRGDK